MILLDTNVVSELLRPGGAGPVHAWLDRIPAEEVGTTAITAFELWHGVCRLPEGTRRRMLETAIGRLLHGDLLHGRILPLDGAAAEQAGRLAAARHQAGRPVDLADTLIAGIALAHGAALATRNLRHFEDAATLRLVDPWAG